MANTPIPPRIKALMDKERLTPREYLRLRKASTNCGYSRAMEHKDRSPEIARHETKLQSRGFDVDRLLDVLRSSEVDPESMDFGARSRVHVVDELSCDLIRLLAADAEIKKQQPHANARTGAILEDSLIDEIVLSLVELYTDMPPGLLSLLQMRLDPKLANPIPRVSAQNQWARAIVEKARNPSISDRQLAKIVGVNQSTISRWRREQNLDRLSDLVNVRQ